MTLNFRACAGLSLIAAFACAGSPEPVVEPPPPPAPPPVMAEPTGNPAPPGDFSGTYEGKLTLLQGENSVLLTLSDVFGNAHICECSEEGQKTSDERYQFQGFVLETGDGRVWLTGEPACCGAGFPGFSARISEAAPLERCTVNADKARFRGLTTSGDVGEDSGAYVVKGDVVEAGADVGEYRMSRFVGKARTIGLLPTADLACP